jgi:hypothetical protein
VIKNKGKVKMNTFLKSGFVAAVVGLGIFASAGSAFAAGCLTPDQTAYSVIDQSDKVGEAAAAADAKGFRCDTVASDYSVQQPVQVKPQARVDASAPSTTPASLIE